jgi:hypothetical protein
MAFNYGRPPERPQQQQQRGQAPTLTDEQYIQIALGALRGATDRTSASAAEQQQAAPQQEERPRTARMIDRLRSGDAGGGRRAQSNVDKVRNAARMANQRFGAMRQPGGVLGAGAQPQGATQGMARPQFNPMQAGQMGPPRYQQPMQQYQQPPMQMYQPLGQQPQQQPGMLSAYNPYQVYA